MTTTREDWAKRLNIAADDLWFDEYLAGLIRQWSGDKLRPPPYCEQDRPPPSPAEMQRRLARDRALQQWHTTPSAIQPFEQWYALQQAP